MKKQVTLAFALVAAGTGFAMADHNSKWGEGTALDPLGIHDARIDSLDTAGDEPFQGAGIDVTIEETAYARQSRPDTIDVDAPDSGLPVNRPVRAVAPAMAAVTETAAGAGVDPLIRT